MCRSVEDVISPTYLNCIVNVAENLDRTASALGKLRIAAINSNILMLNNTLALTGLSADAADELGETEDDDR